MIFKQVEEIIKGSKTQTRRIVKPGETLLQQENPFGGYIPVAVKDQHGRTKWALGHTYAVVPGRGKPTVWYRCVDEKFILWHEEYQCYPVPPENAYMRSYYKPLRIEITAIRRERVNDISREDAIAEGLHFDGQGYRSMINAPGDCISDPRSCYAMLWDSINKRKGQRFSDGPECWVLTFKVVK